MKTIVTFIFSLFFIPVNLQADVYVKGKLYVEGGYRYGHIVPDMEVTNEWWIGKNRVTHIITGYKYDYSIHSDWRLTMDREKQRVIVANLSEKFFFKIPTPINVLSHVAQLEAEILKRIEINGKVTRTGQKKIMSQMECEVYEISDKIFRGGECEYDRRRTVMATEDVPFDWKLVGELHTKLSMFFNPHMSYLQELSQVKGFVLAEKDVCFHRGYQIRWSFEVIEISQNAAPKDIYDLPRGFREQEKFSAIDLLYLGGLLYPDPIY